MLMFSNHRDPLRKYYKIRGNKAEGSLIRNHPELKIPMPALGEVLCIIRDKCSDRSEDVIKEMNRLLDTGIVGTAYIHNANDLFSFANSITKETNDDRDQISPMDALIVATATTNPECSTLYTTDSVLLTNAGISDMIYDWRNNKNYDSLRIRDISEIIKN